MINIDYNPNKGLIGKVFYKEEFIGTIDSAPAFLDMLCQIKAEQCEDYKMEVEVEVGKSMKRTYVYRITKNGTTIPSAYPGVQLWTDILNKKLLYLYNFSIDHSFSYSKGK